MQRATLTLLASINHHPALLDELVIPAALDRDSFINRLLLEQGEAEVMITNPEVMQPLVGFWSKTRLKSWEKLADMIGYEYNPIWNVDGEVWHEGESESHGTSAGSSTEQRTGGRTFTRDRDQTDTLVNQHNDTRTPDLTDAETKDLTDTRTPNLTETRTPNLTETRQPNLTETNSPAGMEQTTNFISADNSEGWSNDTRSETVYSARTDTKQTTGTETTSATGNETKTETGTDTTKHTGTDTTKHTGTETTTGGYTDQDTLAEDIMDTENTTGSMTGATTGQDDREGAESWHEKRQGNIGVTMTQQLLEAEKKLWEAYDVEGFIIKEFKNEFLLMVY